MTIKDFASLCGCNPQTLRYYDRIGLLRPDRVDGWTGYRNYGENQALDFIKIKNLQEADFSIEEIKALLTKSNEDVCQAIEQKLAEEMARLEHMKKIYATYLSQMETMEETVQKIKEKMKNAALQFEAEKEFGITQEYYGHLIDCAGDYMEAVAHKTGEGKINFSDIEYSEDSEIDEEDDFLHPLESGEYVVICEKHNWEKTRNVMEDLPELESGEYLFHFELEEEKALNMAFCNVVLGMVVDQNPGKELTLGCNAHITTDGRNHFWLLKKK